MTKTKTRNQPNATKGHSMSNQHKRLTVRRTQRTFGKNCKTSIFWENKYQSAAV